MSRSSFKTPESYTELESDQFTLTAMEINHLYEVNGTNSFNGVNGSHKITDANGINGLNHVDAANGNIDRPEHSDPLTSTHSSLAYDLFTRLQDITRNGNVRVNGENLDIPTVVAVST